MDFFEAQERARQRTTRLVVLFSLAVLGTILALYGAALFAVFQAGGRIEGFPEAFAGSGLRRFWQPALLGWISVGTLAVVGLGSLYKWNQFRAGGGAVAASVGARQVDPRTTDPAERRLLNVVEEMAIASGSPVPAVYVMDDEPAINAFAAGLGPHDAVVAVTRGTLEKLSRDELQGVVGHEFSHILNGDMRLNVRLSAILFGILVIGLIGRAILRGVGRTRVTSSRDRKGGGAVVAILAAGLALMIIGYVGYFFGRLIQAAVSRQREFLADASAVQFTRNPQGIAGALKKIGGYALGSGIQSDRGAAIGHFFFAHGFRSHLGGLWATHPPLPERIRAIDASFDGEMFAPPEVVDVGRESFVSAGLAPAAPAGPPAPPPRFSPAAGPAAVARAGTLSAAQIANAQLLLDTLPAGLREAARSPTQAPALLCGLLLAPDPALRARQHELVATRAGQAVADELARLEPALAAVGPEHRLPLVHLALPVLRGLAPEALAAFLDALDELVHADQTVSPFEFSLQKVLAHALALGRSPAAATIQFHSFHAVADDLSAVLSVLARATTADAATSAHAFAAGRRQLPLVAERLQFLDAAASTFERLDAALDRLAVASGPIKQRALAAAAHTVGADGQILIAEAELLRAIAAALDCPLPPLQAVA